VKEPTMVQTRFVSTIVGEICIGRGRLGLYLAFMCEDLLTRLDIT